MIYEYSIENGDKPFLFFCDMEKNFFTFTNLTDDNVFATKMTNCVQFDSIEELYKHLVQNYNVNLLSEVFEIIEENYDINNRMLSVKERKIQRAVNLNNANSQKLEGLNGISNVRAQAIIDGRPWQSITDVAQVSGISLNMLKQLNVKV